MKDKDKHKLWCFNRWDLKKYLDSIGGLPDDSILIQICGTPICQEKIIGESEPFYYPSNQENVLNMTFDDIAKEEEHFESCTIYGLHPNQAEEIVDFIDRNQGKDIYVSCRAGRSRSQGIVRYVLDIFGQELYETREDNPCITPNMYVTTMLKRIKWNKKFYEDTNN